MKERTSLLILQKRDYYKKFKFNNLDKIDKFLGKYKLPKRTQEKVENLNRSVTSKEVELVTKKSSLRKAKVQMPSLVTNTVFTEVIPILYNSFRK